MVSETEKTEEKEVIYALALMDYLSMPITIWYLIAMSATMYLYYHGNFSKSSKIDLENLFWFFLLFFFMLLPTLLGVFDYIYNGTKLAKIKSLKGIQKYSFYIFTLYRFELFCTIVAINLMYLIHLTGGFMESPFTCLLEIYLLCFWLLQKKISSAKIVPTFVCILVLIFIVPNYPYENKSYFDGICDNELLVFNSDEWTKFYKLLITLLFSVSTWIFVIYIDKKIKFVRTITNYTLEN